MYLKISIARHFLVLILKYIRFQTVINIVRNLDFANQLALSRVLLPMLGVEPFQKVTVNDFIWGYEDKFYQFARKLESFVRGKDVPKFGFLAEVSTFLFYFYILLVSCYQAFIKSVNL